MKITERLLIKEEVEQLQHVLKMQFGLPPDKPTKDEVIRIIEEMKVVPVGERTDVKWFKVINDIVEYDGIYKYEGLDYSAANNLLNQIEKLLLD